MIFDTVADLRTHLPPKKRLFGLDVGRKTIGLAVSDSDLKVATALETIRRRKFSIDVEALRAAMEERDVGGLVIGLPVSMDGSEGPACQSVRQFAANVDARLEILIAFWDERLSTSAVERFLVEFLRAKDDRFFGPLTAAQLISLATLLLIAGILVYLRRPSSTAEA